MDYPGQAIVCISDTTGAPLIKTKILENLPILKYSPPSYNSFGIFPTLKVPFQNNTVVVKQSSIGFGVGLFTKRNIEKGELISFYSGFIITPNGGVNPFERSRRSLKEFHYEELFIFDEKIIFQSK